MNFAKNLARQQLQAHADAGGQLRLESLADLSRVLASHQMRTALGDPDLGGQPLRDQVR